MEGGQVVMVKINEGLKDVKVGDTVDRNKKEEFEEIMDCIFNGLRQILKPSPEEIQRSLTRLQKEEDINYATRNI